MSHSTLHLFEAYGIELEYMLVDKTTLNVLPIADQLIFKLAGSYAEDDVDLGEIALSNELVAHVLELKTNGPKAYLKTLPQHFHKEIQHLNALLAEHNACLLPSGAHPWMNPDQDMKLWPHGYNEIYAAFHRIFDCRGHGWANLQSTHLNLPFADDHEFTRLHSAIRLILPLLPAIAASTPFIDAKATGYMDSRLTFYGKNQAKIPSIAGNIIPEVILSKTEYERCILKPMYRDIQIHDKEKLLQFEWLNSRGAIARFDRNAIEIRVLDIQECPMMDLALIELIVGVLKLMVAEKFSAFNDQHQETEQELLFIFQNTIKEGLKTPIEHGTYLRQFGMNTTHLSARAIWQHLLRVVNEHQLISKESFNSITLLLERGNLAERLLVASKNDFSRPAIKKAYHQLATCLAQNEMFLP